METSGGVARERSRVLALSFVESFATILLERGIYFFSHDRLGYSEADNLALALAFGVAYTFGARLSHWLPERSGERRALSVLLIALFGVHAALGLRPGGVGLALGFVLVGLLEGAKWPIVESYVGAGLGPDEQLRAVGRFNIAWASAVPLALAATGPIVAFGAPAALFVLAAALNGVSLWLASGLAPKALHLDVSDPVRPPPEQLARYAALLASSRWSMLSSYALLFLLAPLLPNLLTRLGAGVQAAGAWASWLDAVRLATFVLLFGFGAWQGRSGPLWAAALGLPLGFGAILFGTSLPVLLLGEMVFGVFAALTYHAALYYALVVKNAAVSAGGAHEGLIGLGLVLGPGLGFLGHATLGAGHSSELGVLIGAGPLMLAAGYAALRSLTVAVPRD